MYIMYILYIDTVMYFYINIHIYMIYMYAYILCTHVILLTYTTFTAHGVI